MNKQRICVKSPITSTYKAPQVKQTKTINVLVKRQGKLNKSIECIAATMYTSSTI